MKDVKLDFGLDVSIAFCAPKMIETLEEPSFQVEATCHFVLLIAMML